MSDSNLISWSGKMINTYRFDRSAWAVTSRVPGWVNSWPAWNGVRLPKPREGYPDGWEGNGAPVGGNEIYWLGDIWGNDNRGVSRTALRPHTHTGVDIMVDRHRAKRRNIPVRTVAAGVAEYVLTDELFRTGNGVMVVVDHGLDNKGFHFRTYYAHMKLGSLTVKQGDTVTKGQIIGAVGDTGSAAGSPHLHWIIERNRVAVDPFLYLDPPMSLNDRALIDANFLPHGRGDNWPTMSPDPVDDVPVPPEPDVDPSEEDPETPDVLVEPTDMREALEAIKRIAEGAL